jgi:hypothetical protein
LKDGEKIGYRRTDRRTDGLTDGRTDRVNEFNRAGKDNAQQYGNAQCS